MRRAGYVGHDHWHSRLCEPFIQVSGFCADGNLAMLAARVPQATTRSAARGTDRKRHLLALAHVLAVHLERDRPSRPASVTARSGRGRPARSARCGWLAPGGQHLDDSVAIVPIDDMLRSAIRSRPVSKPAAELAWTAPAAEVGPGRRIGHDAQVDRARARAVGSSISAPGGAVGLPVELPQRQPDSTAPASPDWPCARSPCDRPHDLGVQAEAGVEGEVPALRPAETDRALAPLARPAGSAPGGVHRVARQPERAGEHVGAAAGQRGERGQVGGVGLVRRQPGRGCRSRPRSRCRRRRGSGRARSLSARRRCELRGMAPVTCLHDLKVARRTPGPRR